MEYNEMKSSIWNWHFVF